MFIQLLLLRKHSFVHESSFGIHVGYWWQSEICGIDLAIQD